MERVCFIEHKGKRILLIDFSNCHPPEILEIMKEAGSMVSAQPKGSLLTLTDGTNARYNSTVTQALREYTKNNQPFVKAAAVVGMTGLRKVVIQTLSLLTKREFSLARNREEAKEYLAGF